MGILVKWKELKLDDRVPKIEGAVEFKDKIIVLGGGQYNEMSTIAFTNEGRYLDKVSTPGAMYLLPPLFYKAKIYAAGLNSDS